MTWYEHIIIHNWYFRNITVESTVWYIVGLV